MSRRRDLRPRKKTRCRRTTRTLEEMEEEVEEVQGESSTKCRRTMHEQEPSTTHRELDDDDERPEEEEALHMMRGCRWQ